MNTQLIIDKIELLPENIQQQIVDYIDFLTNKYLKTLKTELEANENTELSDELKDLLDKRIAHHEKNKFKAKDAMDVLNDIAQKYGYEL